MSKFRAKTAVHAGHLYHSIKERDYAAELDIRVKCRELKSWRRQVYIPLVVNRIKVCTYIVDFVLEYPDGHEQYIEVKPRWPYKGTPVGELKIKLFKACYPQADFQVVR